VRRKKSNVALLDLQQAFGYTQESLKFLMAPMAHTGQEAVGSMGTGYAGVGPVQQAEAAAHLFQAELRPVTNPPIDSIREELVMSLVSFIGPRPNILDLEGTAKIKRLEVYQPILTNEDLERIRQIGQVKDNQFSSVTIDITYPADKGAAGMSAALDVVCAEAEEAVRSKEYNIIILSDRATGPDRIPIPSLLATSAVHHHLIRQGLRTWSDSLWRQASRTRCTSSPCWPATAPRRLIRIWPSIRSRKSFPSSTRSCPSRKPRSATSRPSTRVC
jgi:glutamate synthase (NADPH/NADH) large chain